jgi:hypothetical protein
MCTKLELPSGCVFSQPDVDIKKLLFHSARDVVIIHLSFPNKLSITISDAEKMIQIIKTHVINKRLEVVNIHECDQCVEDMIINNLDHISGQDTLFLGGKFSPYNLKKTMMYVNIKNIIYDMRYRTQEHLIAIIDAVPESQLRGISFNKSNICNVMSKFIAALRQNYTLTYVGLSDYDNFGVRKSDGTDEYTQAARIIRGLCTRNAAGYASRFAKYIKVMLLYNSLKLENDYTSEHFTELSARIIRHM